MNYELSHRQLQAIVKNPYGLARNNYQLSKARVSYFIKIGELDKQGVALIDYKPNLTMSEISELILESLDLSEFSQNVKIVIQSITFGTDDMQSITR